MQLYVKGKKKKKNSPGRRTSIREERNTRTKESERQQVSDRVVPEFD